MRSCITSHDIRNSFGDKRDSSRIELIKDRATHNLINNDMNVKEIKHNVEKT